MEYQNDFYESERMNAINKAKQYFQIKEGFRLMEQPEPHCAINHESDHIIRARVMLSQQNIVTGLILEKTISLKFIDDGQRSFWIYDGNRND